MDFWVHQLWLDPVIKSSTPQCQTLGKTHCKGQKRWKTIGLPATVE